MDHEAAIGYLDEMRGLLAQNRTEYDRDLENYYRRPAYVATKEAIEQRLLGARRIAERAAPELVDRFARGDGYGWEWSDVREATNTLVGFLVRQSQLAHILEPAGPRIAAARLHPWVWEAAARLWDDGYRRSALQAAALAVESQLRAKLGRYEAQGATLVSDAFKLDAPRANDPRLRLPDFIEGSQTHRSIHEGAMHFGRGCMSGIRNVVTHLEEEPDEQFALEQLAALSVLARWIDKADVVRADQP